jgi:phosphoglycerate dehydrogenase-like enzyme
MLMPGRQLNILIASSLGPDLVERIQAVDPDRLRVIFEPELLPVPRYVADHHGVRRNLSEAQRQRWQSHLAEADVLFDFDWLAPAELPRSAPRLRWIQATSAGIGEMVRRTQLFDSNIIFTTAVGVHANSLAEFALLGLLYFYRGVPQLLRWQESRHWERYTNRELTGARVLVVGLGGVGRAVAARCAQFGLEVWGSRRTANDPPEGVTRLVPYRDIRSVLPAIDGLVLACPLTEHTARLIGPDEFAALRPTAVLVNIARGAVVDEAAMIQALRDGHLAGAALDVFETEPLPPTSPLWSLPNVLISPHSASTVHRENDRIVDIFCENLRRYLDGRPLINLFERTRGY